MKKFVIAFLLGFFAISLHAQLFSGNGDQKLQAGFNFYGYGTGIKATYDYGLSEVFSAGGGAVFYNSGAYYSNFFIFGRGDYHFQELIDLPPGLDLYAGAELGLLGKNYFGLGFHAGARYLTGKVYLFAEVGSNAAAGVGFDL